MSLNCLVLLVCSEFAGRTYYVDRSKCTPFTIVKFSREKIEQNLIDVNFKIKKPNLAIFTRMKQNFGNNIKCKEQNLPEKKSLLFNHGIKGPLSMNCVIYHEKQYFFHEISMAIIERKIYLKI